MVLRTCVCIAGSGRTRSCEIEMEEVEESLQGAISIIDKKITEEVGYLIDEKAEFVKYNQAIKEKLAQKRNLRKNKYKEG